MTCNRRSNFKWTTNELLSLEREYELLEMTVQEIASKHERSVDSILYKLESEEFISSQTLARGFVQHLQSKQIIQPRQTRQSKKLA
jgi:hypothetical protein